MSEAEEIDYRPRGLVRDLPGEEVSDAYTEMINVYMQDDAARRCGGSQQYAPISGRTLASWSPYATFTLLTPLIAYMVGVFKVNTGTSWRIYVYDGSDWVNITPAGVPIYDPEVEKTQWTFTVINGVLVINNGIQAPWYWDGVPANDCQLLPGWDATWRCKSMRAYKSYLLAIGMTENSVSLEHKVRWSTSAETGIPQEWVPAPENDAGGATLSDSGGPLVDGLGLRGDFVLYKTDSCYICSFIGGNFIFQFRKLFLTTGLITQNCVVEINGVHFALTGTDLIAHDGTQVQNIADKKVRRSLFTVMPRDYIHRCVVVDRQVTNEVWFCTPVDGEGFNDANGDRVQNWLGGAYIYNYLTERWGYRRLAQAASLSTGVINDTEIVQAWDDQVVSWGDATRRWDETLYSSTSPQVAGSYPFVRVWTVDPGAGDSYRVDSKVWIVTDSNGTAHEWVNFPDQPAEDYYPRAKSTWPITAEHTSQVTRHALSIHDDERYTQVEEVWPYIQGERGKVLMVQVGMQREYGHSVEWNPPAPFTIGEGSGKVDVTRVGRYMSIKIQGEGGGPWRLYGFKVRAAEVGRYN